MATNELSTNFPNQTVSYSELGWEFASFVMLLLGAIGIIYGWWYRGMGTEILVPSFVALIFACYTKIEAAIAMRSRW